MDKCWGSFKVRIISSQVEAIAQLWEKNGNLVWYLEGNEYSYRAMERI